MAEESGLRFLMERGRHEDVTIEGTVVGITTEIAVIMAVTVIGVGSAEIEVVIEVEIVVIDQETAGIVAGLDPLHDTAVKIATVVAWKVTGISFVTCKAVNSF